MKQYLLSVHYIEGQPAPARDVMAKIYKDVNTLNDEMRATGDNFCTARAIDDEGLVRADFAEQASNRLNDDNDHHDDSDRAHSAFTTTQHRQI